MIPSSCCSVGVILFWHQNRPPLILSAWQKAGKEITRERALVILQAEDLREIGHTLCMGQSSDPFFLSCPAILLDQSGG